MFRLRAIFSKHLFMLLLFAHLLSFVQHFTAAFDEKNAHTSWTKFVPTFTRFEYVWFVYLNCKTVTIIALFLLLNKMKNFSHLFLLFCFVLFQNVHNMTSIDYPNSATIFAAACACIFVVVGIAGKCVSNWKRESNISIELICLHAICRWLDSFSVCVSLGSGVNVDFLTLQIFT